METWIKTTIDYRIEKAREFFIFVGEIFAIFFETIKCSFSGKFYWARLMEQINLLGFGSTS